LSRPGAPGRPPTGLCDPNKRHPESAIARIEYANGSILLFGRDRLDEATKLYEQAAACKAMDATERLDVELAREELE
jgi:hypothetical protein